MKRNGKPTAEGRAPNPAPNETPLPRYVSPTRHRAAELFSLVADVIGFLGRTAWPVVDLFVRLWLGKQAILSGMAERFPLPRRRSSVAADFPLNVPLRESASSYDPIGDKPSSAKAWMTDGSRFMRSKNARSRSGTAMLKRDAANKAQNR
jgi:hypothetical protein